MRKNLFFRIILTLLLPIFLSAENISVESYQLTQAKNVNFNYGSGIAFKKASPYGGGSVLFYLVSDQKFLIDNGKQKRVAEQIPHIGIAKLKPKKNSLEVTDLFPVYFEDNQKLEVSLAGIATDRDNLIWLADREHNHLIKVDLESGAIKDLIKLKSRLAKILTKDQNSKGIVGVSIAPSGEVFTAMRNPLKFTSQDGKEVGFFHLIKFEPKDNTIQNVFIPVSNDQSESLEQSWLGDLQIVDQNRLIIIEQRESSSGQTLTHLNLVSLRDTPFISNLEAKKILKSEDLLTRIQNQSTRSKLELADLSAFLGNSPKSVGLTLVDADTAAVTAPSENKSEMKLWLVNLPEPLYYWTWKEWAVFWILGFILVLSTLLTILLVFKKQPSIN